MNSLWFLHVITMNWHMKLLKKYVVISFAVLYRFLVSFVRLIMTRYNFELAKVFCVHSDPHVRIAGRLDDVKLAREKIMQLLDTRVRNENTYIKNIIICLGITYVIINDSVVICTKCVIIIRI